MLPRRKHKEPKPESRWRSQKHREWLTKTFHCAMCGKYAPIEAAHVSLGGLSGTGLKTDDFRCVPLCGTTIEGLGCHDKEHTGSETFWADYRAKHGQTVEDLIDDLCTASPVKADIRRVKAERANG
jgi:hypothetical protein